MGYAAFATSAGRRDLPLAGSQGWDGRCRSSHSQDCHHHHHQPWEGRIVVIIIITRGWIAGTKHPTLRIVIVVTSIRTGMMKNKVAMMVTILQLSMEMMILVLPVYINPTPQRSIPH